MGCNVREENVSGASQCWDSAKVTKRGDCGR